jgi:Leucine-rich repeat (LRR) protein
LSLFLSFVVLCCPLLSEKCNPDDKKVLLQIKQDFGNPYVLSSWDPDTDCCDWYCVTCDLNTNRITELFVITGSLPGQIPASIGDLSFPESLTLKKQANLTGPIQPAIAKLKNLNFLRISYNAISGPVPDFLSGMEKLTFLDLSFKKLFGSIPSSLSKLPNLGTLRLDRNMLTGTIPDSLGEFKQTTFYLELSHNQLSGQIPASFNKLDLFNFNVSYNKLSGKIPVGGDLQNFDSYSYFHNANLCGAPLGTCKS